MKKVFALMWLQKKDEMTLIRGLKGEKFQWKKKYLFKQKKLIFKKTKLKEKIFKIHEIFFKKYFFP